jgi:hypothetical protein
MEQFKDLYKDSKGRTDSMYVYCLYECSQEMLKNHVKKQLDIIDRVSDPFKRKLFSSRYFLIRSMLEENMDDHNYNCVLFIGDTLSQHQLTNFNKSLLKKFDHQSISFVYDDHFDLEYLEDLIFNNVPYNIYRIDNNRIDYLHVTKTKKIKISEKESKSLDIKEFVDSTLPPNERYLLFGVSAKLKNFTDDRAYTIINHHIKDDDFINIIMQMDQEDLLINLSNDLMIINDSKQKQKIIFKNDIPVKIKNAQLEKLYIEHTLFDKFINNIKKNNLDVNFKIIIIDPRIKSFVQGNENTLEQYGGVLGVAYY